MVSWSELVVSRERILPHCSVLECRVQCWAPSMEILERVQGRTTKKDKGLEHLSEEERQRGRTGWRRLQRSLSAYTPLEGGCGENRARLSSLVPGGRWHR